MIHAVQFLAVSASLLVAWVVPAANAAPFEVSRWSATTAAFVNFDVPLPSAPVLSFAPRPWPESPQAVVGSNGSDAPSPVPAAFYGLPRQLKADIDRISFNTPSVAPIAFVRFCMRYPQDCTVRRMAFRPRPVALTEARRTELVNVNRDVNRAIKPQANVNGVMAEEWRVSPGEGDCNDYAVTKRHELLARGWPSRSLLLVEVVIRSGEHHLVLVVRTREDDLVLDNLNWNIRSVSQMRYRWVRAQQATNPKFWSTISVTRATRVAMNVR